MEGIASLFETIERILDHSPATATAMNPALTYSYIRFSTPEQAKGDSLRRQTELRDRWLSETGAKLDATLTLRDEGVSGHTGEHRENSDCHGLAWFLDAIRSNRVKRGSYRLPLI
jgi:hypothetical protein